VDGGAVARAWLHNVTAIAGPYLAAIAYHSYPGANGTPAGTLTQFYSGLQNPSSFPGNYPETEAIVRSSCRSCNLQVFVDEFNGALGGTFRKYLQSYPDAVLVAAALIQAAREGVPHVLYFDFADLDPDEPYAMLLTGGAPRATYLLYSQFLANLTLGQVHASSLTGSGAGNYSMVVTGPTESSLFVVNTNVTNGIRLTLPAMFLNSSAATVWAWSPSAADPAVAMFHGVPLTPTWTIPPQGIFLVTAALPAD
jgi:hypothetical protein